MKRINFVALVAMLVLSINASATFGQATATGAIQGTVLDKSEAAIVGAQVEASNKATGLVRSTVTSDSGYYRIEFLPVGTYKIKISKTGFVAMESAVEVIIGQAVTLNGELQIGSASETIEITSTVPLVDVAKTDVSQNITPTEVQELPMIGRDVATQDSVGGLVPQVLASPWLNSSNGPPGLYSLEVAVTDVVPGGAALASVIAVTFLSSVR